MSEKLTKRIRINKDMFCDGHGYLLTSTSLGGSDLTAAEVSETLFRGDGEKSLEMAKKGICFPIAFEGDCALDENTLFVIGDLNEQEERNWIARLRWKLNIPCGKLVLVCGWAEEDIEQAMLGESPDRGYPMYQTIEVPPNEYLVEIYAYIESLTVQLSFDEEDENGYLIENEEQAELYKKKYPGIEGVDYIIRLSALKTEPKMPRMEESWFEDFEFRQI